MGELTIRMAEAKLVGLLESAVKEHARRLELVRRADEIAAMTPEGVKQTDSVDLIRQMRDERDREFGY